MILRTRGLLLVAVLTAISGLVVMFPARVAYHWARLPFVAMSGIQGTVWKGQAREFSTNGIYLRDLGWSLHPLRLFTGKAVYSVSGSPVSGFFDAIVAVQPDGTLAFENVSASLPLATLAQAGNVPGLSGNASLQLERLEIANGTATALDGSVAVAGLTIPQLGNIGLGGYRAEFSTQESGIVASVEDTDGVVDLAGRLEIRPDRSYAFLGRVIAKNGAPEQLQRQLRPLPVVNDRGQRELRLEGTY